jgi:hypothetical protein
MGCCPCRPLQQPIWFSYYGPIHQRDAAEAINAAVADHLQEIGATVSIPIHRVVATPLRVPVALLTPPITPSDEFSLVLSFSTSLPGRVTLIAGDSSESFEYGIGSGLTQTFRKPPQDTFTIKFDFESHGDVSARMFTLKLGNGESSILDDKIVINGAISTISKVYREAAPTEGDAGFSEGMCLICCSETATVVAFPCRHCCMCRECSERFATMSNHCPVCRGAVLELVECVTAQD